MTTRKDKLEKALALIEEPREVAIMAGQQKYLGFILGAEHENSRLAPLHAALISAVEALETAKEYLNTSNDCQEFCDLTVDWHCEECCMEQSFDKALSKIDKVLGEE